MDDEPVVVPRAVARMAVPEPVRRLVRAGIVVVAVAAVVAVATTFLPGYDVYENDGLDCLGRVLDMHSRGGPCDATREWLAGTRPVGGAGRVIAILLALLPGLWVWRRPSAGRAFAWGAAVWTGLVVVSIATFEVRCIGDVRLAPRAAAHVHGWAMLVVTFGPVAMALVGAVVGRASGRRP